MNVISIGSFARKDGDRFSDRDVLIVGDSKEMQVDAAMYKARGVSVVTLTPEKFAFLSRHGSLFLKHAIDEGVCLKGGQDSWKRLTHHWHSTGDYSSEIDSNINLLSVLQSIPVTSHGASAAIDIMICSVRNILIRNLASKGIFKFSWQDLACYGSMVSILPSNACRAIAWAREQKNRRRFGMRTNINIQQVEEFADMFAKVLMRPSIGWTSSNTRIEVVASRFETASYAQLRAYELLCANAPYDVGLKRLRSIVSQPSYFCSSRFVLH